MFSANKFFFDLHVAAAATGAAGIDVLANGFVFSEHGESLAGMVTMSCIDAYC